MIRVFSRYAAIVVLCLWRGAAQAAPADAIAYLEAEAQRWRPENGCFSCHNNGDAARALFHAGRRDSQALAQTREFLRKPAAWTGRNGKADPLAILQYVLALRAAGEVESPAGREALRRLAAEQRSDGHWALDAEEAAGSPVTYGPVLGTALAFDLLKATAAGQRAKAWLEARKTEHPMDIAAVTIALGRRADADKLAALQAADGSWNGGEVFDTALGVIALVDLHPRTAAKGRAWLLRNQLGPGGWPGTTRPAGGQSYAQHISTSGWALEALTVSAKLQE